MRPLLLSLAVFLAAAGCTVLRTNVGRPPSQEALALEPGSATLEEVLALLGPPDGFCWEPLVDESLLKDLVVPDDDLLAESLRQEDFTGCLLWVGHRSQVSWINPGKLISVATMALGVRGGAPLIFGTFDDRPSFLRIWIGEGGRVEAVHFSGERPAPSMDVNPF